MKFIITILLVLFIITIFSCDFEKFIDSNHKATPSPTTAKIFGKVYNIFDEQPVHNARVLIDNQATFTDESGNYLLHYYLGSDEERDQTISIRISASRYMLMNRESIIYPENKMDFPLEYGAPIIQKVARVDSFCQAIIFDYQGFDNIGIVYGHFFYKQSGKGQVSLITKQAMTGIESDSSNIGYFQCKVLPEIPGYGSLISTFLVKASDRTGFSDSTSFARSGVDSLLFPVNPF